MTWSGSWDEMLPKYLFRSNVSRGLLLRYRDEVTLDSNLCQAKAEINSLHQFVLLN